MSDLFKTKISYLVASLNRQLEKEVEEELRDMQMPIEQVRVLDALMGGAAETGMTMSELAKYAVVDVSTFTKIIDRMVSDSLVYRTSDPKDRRKVRVLLSERGKAVLSKLRPLIDNQEAQLHRAIVDVTGDAALSGQIVTVLQKLCERQRVPAAADEKMRD